VFVGHYGLAPALKPAVPGVSLGTLFVATQLMDLVFSILLLAGWERVRLYPGVPGPAGVELVFVPYSHSLLGALVLAAAAGAAAWAAPRKPGGGTRRRRGRAAAIIAALVASHYALDAAVHAADLPLLTHRPELGLGPSVPVSVALETALVLGGSWLYLRTTVPADRLGRVGIPVLAAALVGFNAYVATTPPPGGVLGLALSNLAAYTVLAVAAHWLDQHRRARAGQPRGPGRRRRPWNNDLAPTPSGRKESPWPSGPP
jgi:hypothetical protein